MKISLIRHAKVNMNWPRICNSIEFDELEQNEDISVRGGVKLAKEYVAHLEGEIAKLKESNELKKEYLKKAVGHRDK